MSNLGDYQRIVELIKKVGGPIAAKRYATLGAAGLLAIGGLADRGILMASPMVRNWLDSLKRRDKLPGTFCTVHSDATDEQGLQLVAGDVFRVLERDDDSVLIEVVGRDDNPWVISGKLLNRISDFPSPAGPAGEAS